MSTKSGAAANSRNDEMEISNTKGVRIVRTGATGWLGLGAAVGPTLFTCSWLVLGQLSPAYYGPSLTIARHSGMAVPISWLGLGSTGPYMDAAFVVCGLLLLGGIVASFQGIPEMSAFARWSSTILLGLSPLGLIVCGLKPMHSIFPFRTPGSVDVSVGIVFPPSLSPVQHDLQNTYYVSRSLLLTFSSPVHSVGFLLTVASPVLSFVVAGLFLRRVPRWRRFGSWLLLGSLLTLALVILFFATFDPYQVAIQVSKLSALGLGGLTNRALVLEVHAWFVALGWVAFVRPRCQQAREASSRGGTGLGP